MLPFHRIYSFIFKSFDIKSETALVEKLSKEWVSDFLIVKRSWIYALATSWIALLLISAGIGHILLMWITSTPQILQITNTVLLSLSLILFLYSVISYISHFRETYGWNTVSSESKELIRKLEDGDKYFSRFFNQTLLNQIILFWLGLFHIWVWFFWIWWSTNWQSLSLDIILIILQWIFLSRYRKKMIDLDMDYTLIIPGRVMSINQSGMLASSQNIDGEKIKSVSARYTGIIGSIFHYGSIEIMTEGDSTSMNGTLPLYYVHNPVETARKIEELALERIPQKDHKKSPGSHTHQTGTREKVTELLEDA